MEKKILNKFTIIILLLVSTFVFSQNRTEDFLISLPEKKVSKSLYKTIKLIDARVDSTNMGIVQKGAFNAKARVVPTTPLRIQFQNLLNTINNNDAQNGELVLYLKQFSFAEITGMMSEKGYCYFQAFLFSKNDEGKFQPLNKIDTLIVHSSMDVTKATMKKGSELIANFITRNISKKNISPEVYTFSEIKNFDKVKKSTYPLYSTPSLVNGLYTNFENFRDQKPADIVVSRVNKIDDEKIVKLYFNENRKDKTIDKANYYALVYEGTPYVFSELDGGFLKLKQKEDGDYYFTARIKSNAKTGNVILASAFFGIIGGLIASDASANFELKLDYLNGGFIPIKEVKK